VPQKPPSTARKAKEKLQFSFLGLLRYWKLIVLGVATLAGYLWFQGKDEIIMPEKPKYKPKKVPKAPKDIDWAGKIKKDLDAIDKKRSTIKSRHDLLKEINSNYRKKKGK
jgi:hypothetical protein